MHFFGQALFHAFKPRRGVSNKSFEVVLVFVFRVLNLGAHCRGHLMNVAIFDGRVVGARHQTPRFAFNAFGHFGHTIVAQLELHALGDCLAFLASVRRHHLRCLTCNPR